MKVLKIIKIILLLIGLSIGLECCKTNDERDLKVIDSSEIPEPTRWWNDQVFYEIFVRSFYDSNGDGIGDFQGIIRKLDYLNDGNPETDTDLGITAIWLMPIFPSSSYHGYDVIDYYEVNQQYGSMNDFKQLITEAHNRGIKVIIDLVVNHTSFLHPWFQKSAAGLENKTGWYIWSSTNPGYKGPWGQTVWHQSNSGFYYGLFGGGMPDLNYNSLEVSNEIKKIARYWYETIGVDGFRVDAAGSLIEEGTNQSATQKTLDWWRNFYSFQKKMSPALMTVGEVWSPTATVKAFSDKRLDYCFEFDLAYALIDAVKTENPSWLNTKLSEVLSSYPSQQFGIFLTNHDQNRIISELTYNLDKAKLAASIYLTLPGIPYLYYGEEIAMRGVKPDEDLRRPMQWSPSRNAGFSSVTPWYDPDYSFYEFNVESLKADPNSIWNHYQKLIKARKANSALLQGDYLPMQSQAAGIYAFVRIKESNALIVIHNLTGSNQKPIISITSDRLMAGSYKTSDLLTGNSLTNLLVTTWGNVSNFSPTEEMKPYSTLIIRLSK